MAVRIQNIKNVVKIAILQNHGEETNHLMKEGVIWLRKKMGVNF
jgi:hypothetical protein